MSTSESFQALRRANPRREIGFEQSMKACADSVRLQLAADEALTLPAMGPRRSAVHKRGRPVRASAATVGLAAAAIGVIFLTVGSLGTGPSVENGRAAIRKAASMTAASAERSGTAVVRTTHNGRPWAGKTVRWNGADVSIVEDAGPQRASGGELRVVDGTLYGPDAGGGWLDLGSPESIDPGSGTTPEEQLAAVREDVGGVTLRRITRGMSGLTAGRLADDSVVYRGTVPAGLIARESGFKDGQRIRVFPFGYVAHDEAADPAALLDTAVTVTDGIVRKIALTWGTTASRWTYTVAYSNLGETPPPVAPRNARSLLEERLRPIRRRAQSRADSRHKNVEAR
jgi:hypothetical protein